MATTQALRSDPNSEPDPRPGRLKSVRSHHRLEHHVELCECMIDIAAALYNVSGRDLRHPGRSSHDVARVRQIAMYVAHVVLGLTMNEVGRGFGRDRTTVLYACHLVEDMREDEEFDRIIALTERVAAAALRNRDGRY
ncbi:MAG: chromosomal replication initiator DnaA [Mesorhizobium sp.]|nr:helix-turn-helix domain-containing protein [Mesorhizobium sp.]MCO5159940.1 chromosomal replication initiator DnaA [Mesorhizobium sp.]